MTIPTEAIIALLSANFAFLSLCAHILFNVSNNINSLCKDGAVEKEATKLKFESLARHNARNQQETDRLTRHLGLSRSTQGDHA